MCSASPCCRTSHTELAIIGPQAAAVVGLPPIHRDPFDRLLIAQSMIEGIALLTADPVLARYPGSGGGLTGTPVSRQHRPRLGRIGGDLRAQFVEPGELPLAAQERVQRDRQLGAVQVAGEVEQMHLQPALGPGCHGRAPADIGDARTACGRPAAAPSRHRRRAPAPGAGRAGCWRSGSRWCGRACRRACTMPRDAPRVGQAAAVARSG